MGLVTSPPKINRSNNCKLARAAHLLVHFIAVVLHDYNVALPSYTFYGGNVVGIPVRFFFFFFFFTAAHFHLAGR